MEVLERFFSQSGFMPHGHCYLWKPGLVWLHVASDAIVGLSYTIIPVVLAYFVRRRRDIPYNWMFWCFAGFIVSCGMTHYLEVWTVWRPDYWLSGGVKALTAAVSLTTALLLARLVPDALALPHPADLRAANEAIAETEALYRETLESSLDAFLIFRLVRDDAGEPVDLRYVDVNSAAVAFLDQTLRKAGRPGVTSRDDVIGRRLGEVFPQDLASQRLPVYLSVARTGKPVREELPLRYADGSLAWHHAQIGPMRDGVSVTIRDVTARREDEERLQAALAEKEVLLREVHHRVKNNLQLISSLLNLQASQIEDPEVRTPLEEARARVQSIALVHERLYRSEDLADVDVGDYLQNLASVLVASLGPTDRVRLEVAADRIRLPLDTAIPCGLVANELVTNALKHAFPGGRSGTVRVELRRAGAFVRLSVQDDGVGMPAAFIPEDSPSLGLQLVASLTEQMGAALEVDRTRGTRFTLNIPAPEEGARWPAS